MHDLTTSFRILVAPRYHCERLRLSLHPADCQPGTFIASVDAYGLLTCENCTAGTVVNAINATSCSECRVCAQTYSPYGRL